MIYIKNLTKELTYTAIGIFVVLLAILVSTQTINLLGRAAQGRISADAVAALIGFWSLGLTPLLLILTVFISILTVLTRYWREHEMSVWLSCGLSLRDWVWPIMRFTLPFFFLVTFMATVVSPWASFRSQEYAEILKQREELSMITPGVFREIGKDNRVYFIETFDPDTGAAQNIFIQETINDEISTVFANSGYLRNENHNRLFVLEEGTRYTGTPGSANYQKVAFDELSLIIDSRPKTLSEINDRQTIPTKTLWSSDNPKHKAELMWRLSMGISVLVLAYLAIPLSYLNPRSGQTYNLLFALGLYLVYQNGVTFLRNMIGDGDIPMAVGLPPMHLLLFILGWVLIRYRMQPAGRFIPTLLASLKTKS